MFLMTPNETIFYDEISSVIHMFKYALYAKWQLLRVLSSLAILVKFFTELAG